VAASNAIAPQDPTGAQLSIQSATPGVDIAGKGAIDERAWGPRVVMCATLTLWLGGAQPESPNRLSGTTHTCPVIESP